MKTSEMRHYFFYDGRAAILSIPSNFSSEAWGQLQSGLIAAWEPNPTKRRFAYLYSLTMYPDQSRGASVFWDHELAGSSGASYLLMPMPGATELQIEETKAHIRTSFDAVSVRVLRPTRFIQNEAEASLGAILAKGEWSDAAPLPSAQVSSRSKTTT